MTQGKSLREPVVITLRNLPPGTYEIDDNGDLVEVWEPVELPELKRVRNRYDKALLSMMDEGVPDDKDLWCKIKRLEDEMAELEVYQEALDEVRSAEDEESA